jgi:hypothetical protein
MKLNQPAMPIKILDRKKWRLVTAIDIPVREYAAIHLCVPDSGNDELDAMIRRAQREKLAGKALSGIIAHPEGPAGDWEKCAKDALKIADAVIAASKGDK